MSLFGGEVVYKEDLRDSNDLNQSNSTSRKDDKKEIQAWTQEGPNWFRKDMPLQTWETIWGQMNPSAFAARGTRIKRS